MYRDVGEQSDSIRFRDVTSPINELDVQSSSSRGQKHRSPLHSAPYRNRTAFAADDSPFFDNDMLTMRSSSSSSDGLPHVTGLNWEGSVESNEVSTQTQSVSVETQLQQPPCTFFCQDSDQCNKSSSRKTSKGHHSKCKGRHGNSDAAQSSGAVDCGVRSHAGLLASYTGPEARERFLDPDGLLNNSFFYVQSWFHTSPPLLSLQDLAEFLEQIGCSKYLPLLEEQDIDLRIFLTLTENDLKEIGIT